MGLKEKVIEAILKRIYDKFNVKDDIDPDLFQYTWSKLNKAVEEGVGIDIKLGDPNYDFLQELKMNNAVFAAFKTHRQQNDLFALLTDENGNPRSFNDFRKASEPVIGEYNVNWLSTEHTTAIRSARTAARFRDYMRDRDVYPNIRWLRSAALDPRVIHQKNYNTVRSLIDTWWKTNYPGCLWNCQCDMENTDDPITHIGYHPVGLAGEKGSESDQDEKDPGLDRNPAYTGSIFTDSHPYVTSAYPGAQEAVKRFIKTIGDLKHA